MTLKQALCETNSLTGRQYQPEARVLIVTAVPAEREAVLKALRGNPGFEVLAVGVGPVAAAVNTTKALVAEKYRLVISAGIGGGFQERTRIGSLVIGTEIIAGDLGAETAEGFKSLENLGFGLSKIQTAPEWVACLTDALKSAELPVDVGPVLTLSTVTGTEKTATELAARITGASAEAMEGFGVGFAAHEFGLPVVEIRSISNMVGPRDPSGWQIQKALTALEAAFQVIMEVV